MSHRNLRQHVADFYSDKSLSPASVERLVSLAVADRTTPSGGASLRFPGRWIYSMAGVAAGIAMTLLAAPLFNTQDGAARDFVVESQPIRGTTLVKSPSKPMGGCRGCKKIAAMGDGFCCGKGRDFGVPHTSKKLHAALVGHKIDAANPAVIPCKQCSMALKGGGPCNHRCMVVGKTYESPVSFVLAKGIPTPEDFFVAPSHRCKRCKAAFENNGRCESCGVGFVAGRRYDKVEAYTASLAALKTLTKAAKYATKCEECAVAMVVDGTCEHCKVSYKNGNLVVRGG